MVTTRRQSGVLSKAVAEEALQGDDTHVDSASDDDELSSDEDDADPSDEDDSSDEDFTGARQSRKAAAKPPTKRQKVASRISTKAGDTSSKEKKPVKRRKKDLSLIFTMPLDILFEIFSQMPPKDLLSMAQTTKAFRKMLLAPNAITVWKAARVACNGPEPPMDFNEVRWAALVFGKTCQSCGAKGVPKVDWGIRKRLCKTCKKAHLVNAKRFKSKFPDYQVEMLDYLPCTDIGPYTVGFPYTVHEAFAPGRDERVYYWDGDIHALADEYETFYHAAFFNSKAAVASFEKWKKGRQDLLDDIKKKAPGYKQWKWDMEHQKELKAEEDKKKRLEAVKSRFLELGYNNVDIDKALTIRTDGISTGTPDITNAVWTRLRQKLEPGVQFEHNSRLAKEMQAITDARMTTFETAYNAYTAQLKPSDAYCCPPAQTFRPLLGVNDLIEADRETSILAKNFEPVINNIAEHISNYQAERRKDALGTIPASDNQSSDPFGLGKNVFICEQPTSRGHYRGPSGCTTIFLLGWPQMLSHFCVGHENFTLRPGVMIDMPHKIVYDAKLSQVSSTLISLLGLSPATASIADIDRKDGRFVCVCEITNKRKGIFTWRGAIRHTTPEAQGWGSRKPCEFRLATTEETIEARQAAAPAQNTVKVWSCNHCHVFLDAQRAENKSTILGHLRTEHAILEPTLLEDYFLNERCQPISEVTHIIEINNPTKPNCQCLRCPLGASRRFIRTGVIAHLQAKHKIPHPNEGNDFKIDPNVR